MPPVQQGSIDGKPGNYRLRWLQDGARKSKSGFATKSEARTWFRETVEPALRGEAPAKPDLTFAAFVALYLDRHAGDVRPRTITTLRVRLAYAEKRFGDTPLRDLERMVDEISSWRARQSDGMRYPLTGALRQCLGAAVRWGYMSQNPAVLAGKNRQPAPRTIRVFSVAEVDAIGVELSVQYQSLPMFAAASGLRPEEWMALERRDVDRSSGVLNVRRTVSSGEVVELGKTARSRRQVPLSTRAVAALDALPARLDTPLLWPSPTGGLLDIDNFRFREWSPAVDAAGVVRPARIYDLRSTFASNALAPSSGISVFELARVMGTSVEMVESHYGSLLDGAATGLAERLSAGEMARESQEETM
jgi:integrase